MRVLCEALNASKKGGTGIATYIRSLAKAATGAGFDFDGLLHSYLPLDRRNKVVAEIELYDVNNRTVSGLTRYIELPFRYLIGVPFGIRGIPLPERDQSVLVSSDFGERSAKSGFSKTYAARMFEELSNLHFDRFGARATLRLDAKHEIFHATHPIPLMKKGAANIYTIHDLVPLRLPHTTLDDKKHYFRLIKHLAKSADHIVTVSESSKRDIMALTGIEEGRITNTYQAVDLPPDLVNRDAGQISQLLARVFQLEYKEFYVFLGAIEPKKNVARLIDGYLSSGSARPLIIVGGLGWDYESDVERMERKELTKYRLLGGEIISESKVRRMGFLPLSHVLALMQGSRALIFPSLYEGFGLPVLEGMSLGTPVITSNVSSLPEVAGDAAILVNPLDIDAIGRAIMAVDRDEDLCAELSRKGLSRAQQFSMRQYQEKVARLYSRLG